MFKIIRNLLIIIIVFGILTALIDYVRMTTGNVPIFNISSYSSKERIQSYRGLFYQGSRKITVSPDEPLVDSSEITFTVLTFDINVPRNYKEVLDDFNIETLESSECGTSKLIYADLKNKVYTYCLDEINIVDNEKKIPFTDYIRDHIDLIEDIDHHMGYMGLYKDNKTILLRTRDDGFSNNGLAIYRCNDTNINDVYIGPINMSFQSDFCTFKDDDFKYIYTIEEIPKAEVIPAEGEVQVIEDDVKEIFFEDDNYKYEFNETKSDRVFIVIPSVRGREEKKIALKDALNNKLVTIEELENKGLKFNKIDK